MFLSSLKLRKMDDFAGITESSVDQGSLCFTDEVVNSNPKTIPETDAGSGAGSEAMQAR